jgi:adenylate cyclase
LILFAYLATHLLNHALGLWSLEAMEAGRQWFLLAWRNPVGTAVLYGALGIHFLLALWSLYRRQRLRMSLGEALQVIMGLSVPLLLATHVVGTRLAHTWFEVEDSYTYVVLALWHFRPDIGVKQALVLLLAWTHGCIGLYFWLRLKSWYARSVPWLFSLALLLPVFALLGFVAAGREITIKAQTSGWVADALVEADVPEPAERDALNRVRSTVPVVFWSALGITLVARVMRQRYEHRRGRVHITYPNGRQIVVPVGLSVLEASRLENYPHASVCNGKGRCSTCRVRVIQGWDRLPASSPEEQRVLQRIGSPPHVRLACQLRPAADIAVVPLLPADARASAGFRSPDYHHGQEQEIAVLFADLRGFTRLAEPKFPYDVVFFLNRYFEAIGAAIKAAGGIPNQFTGDGVMALFGVGVGPVEGSRRALLAAGAMLDSLEILSNALAEELSEPLRMGIGIHTGPAVVGRMGYEDTTYLTAVGDTVHVASRLEALNKEYQGPLIISEQVAQRAGIDVSDYPAHLLTVRNRTEPLTIRVIDAVPQIAARVRPLLNL